MSETTLTATQLAVQLGNAPGAPETIYLSEEKGANKLTLSTTLSAEATFTEAKPVLKAEASKAKGSLLYLDLRGLKLSAKELEGLEVSGKGWASLIDPAGYVCLAPEETFTQKANAPIEVKIEGLAMSKPPAGGSVQLYLVVFRVPGVTSGNTGLPWAFKSLLAPPPSGEANLHEAITLSVPEIYVVSAKGDYAGYGNNLSFTLSPGDKPLSVKAGSETKFELTFVYAAADDPEGYGALCTTEQALETKLKAGQNAQGWHITPPKDAQNPAWVLQPPEGKPIVSAQGVVNFLISELKTELRPGPTLMFLTYSGVPGYENGAYIRLLEKVGHATIDSFTITPNPAVLKEGSAKVKLQWKASNATAVSISGVGVFEAEGEEEVEILETTPFTLTAEGPPNSRNSAIKTETAVVLPVINSFEAEPEAIAQDDFPRSVELSWNVATKGKVKFVTSTGKKDPHDYDPVGSVGFEVETPQMITLVPESGASDPLIRRSVVVSAFKPESGQADLAQAPSCVAASPTAAFVAVGSPGGVTALDTMTYQPIGQQIAVPQGANDLAFSADGSTLYVACAGKAVAPISVKSTGTLPQYEFANLGNFALEAEPRGIAVAPSGKYVYVSTAEETLVVLKVESNRTLSLLTTLAVGAKPEGVGVLPTGAQVYVANSGGKSVTVVGVGENGHHEVVKTVKNLPEEPAGVAATANGKVLLIACRSGKVAVRSVEFPGAVGNTLDVGAGACDVALVPGGRYAVVANKGANNVSLLGLGETPGSCEVLNAGIATGAAPVSISVTPEAGLVFVASSGAKSLSVLTLAQYAETEQPVKAGGQVTDVVASPDGKKAVIWHDARQVFKRGEPSTGVFVYDLKSGEVAEQLANQPIIDFAYRPAAGSNEAFAITKGNAFIEVVNTSTWSPLGGFNLAPLTSGAPRSLSVSADGSTLFVLAGDESNKFDLVALAIGKEGKLTAIGNAVRVFAASRGTNAEVAAAPDASRAYVLDEADAKLWVVARSGEAYALEPNPVAIGASSTAMALSPDGSELYVLSRPGKSNTLTSVATKGLTTKTLVLGSITYSSLIGIVVSPDSSKVLVTDGVMVGVRIFDAESLRLIQTISFENNVLSPMGVAVTPTGSQVFTANVNSNNLGVAQQVQPTGGEGRGTEGGNANG